MNIYIYIIKVFIFKIQLHKNDFTVGKTPLHISLHVSGLNLGVNANRIKAKLEDNILKENGLKASGMIRCITVKLAQVEKQPPNANLD